KVEKSEFSTFVGLGINALFTSRSCGKRWIDQTPLYTLIADLLAEMFPDALFLHIIRDGRRVVHSMVHFANATGEKMKEELAQADRLPAWATNFKEACKVWSRFVQTSMRF